MVKLNPRQALLYLLVLFILSAILNYFFPGQPLIHIGFIVSIFLSIFTETQRSTVLTALATAFVVLAISAIKSRHFFSIELLSDNVFILVITTFTTLIVLYTKRLLRDIQFDKTHMTSLFENATEGIMLTNGKGEIILVNPSAEKIFGYKEAELTGNLIEVLIPERFKHGHDKMRKGFYQDPQNRQMGVGRDLFAKKKDGTDFPVEVSLSHYRQNEESFVIAFVVDITARKNIEFNVRRHRSDLEKLTEEMRVLNTNLEMKVEQRTQILTEALQKLEQSQKELNEALKKEKELNEIKSRLVSMASHEFRTPLSTILSSASLLSKYVNEADQDKRGRHIERIKGSVKNLNDILEDFLSLGKLNEGKVSTEISPFGLISFIEETTEDIKGLLKTGQRIISNHSKESIIYSDKKLLKNVLLNLISNAIKFSEPGTNIIIESNVADGLAVIKIKDQGMGILKEDQEHLFSSFFRGANVVNIQGSGLGLHIVKRYIGLMSGTIAFDSKINEGTTFTITIPAKLKTHAQHNIGN